MKNDDKKTRLLDEIYRQYEDDFNSAIDKHDGKCDAQEMGFAAMDVLMGWLLTNMSEATVKRLFKIVFTYSVAKKKNQEGK